MEKLRGLGSTNVRHSILQDMRCFLSMIVITINIEDGKSQTQKLGQFHRKYFKPMIFVKSRLGELMQFELCAINVWSFLKDVSFVQDAHLRALLGTTTTRSGDTPPSYDGGQRAAERISPTVAPGSRFFTPPSWIYRPGHTNVKWWLFHNFGISNWFFSVIPFFGGLIRDYPWKVETFNETFCI